MPGPVVVLGELIVDLLADAADRTAAVVPHLGGAPVNAAVTLARCGVTPMLLSGVGGDELGRFALQALDAAGVDTSCVVERADLVTPNARVTFDGATPPTVRVEHASLGALVAAAGPAARPVVAAAAALVVGCNTLVGEPERAVTTDAVAAAHESGVPVAVLASLYPHRWPDEALARSLAAEVVAGAAFVQANAVEATLLTGERDPAVAAQLVVDAGAALAVVTAGAGGLAIAGGGMDARVVATERVVEQVDPTGAGDALFGVLLAGLVSGGWTRERLLATVPVAQRVAAAVVGRRGATVGLPDRIHLPDG